ncbi:MAG: SIMPL domain-containing protein [Anaerolineales bacterium]|nr:SIMPL domain-containing protein [Anaerolineales bacterium]
MKLNSKFINVILAVLVGFLLLSAEIPHVEARAASSTPDNQTSLTCDSSRSVHVTGSAMINVTPDRTLIQLGVQSNGVTPDAVEAANTKAIQKVINAVKAQGVEAKDIATDIYVIEPIYEDYDSLYIKGYRINNVVAVTLRDVNKTSNILVAALKAGANQVINVEFYTSELRKYRDQAREMAMKAANEKAQALASAAGAETGCVLSINENSWSYYNGWWYGRNQNLWTQNTIQNTTPSGDAGSSTADEPVSLGQISVKAEVSVSYGLK